MPTFRNCSAAPNGAGYSLGIERRGEPDDLIFNVTRDDIPIHTIDAAYMAAPGIGYIRVNRFAGTTMQEFRQSFDGLGPLSALILDLRGNGGGLLDQAIEMSEFFLPAGSVIVSTEGGMSGTSVTNRAGPERLPKASSWY